MKITKYFFAHIACYSFIYVLFTLAAHAMNFHNIDLPLDCISINGVQRTELFKALYEHAKMHSTYQKRQSIELGHTLEAPTIEPNNSVIMHPNPLLSHHSVTDVFGISFDDALGKLEKNNDEGTFYPIEQYTDMDMTEKQMSLRNEQHIKLERVESYQLGLCFTRRKGRSFTPGCVQDSLDITRYNKVYGHGKAQEIHQKLLNSIDPLLCENNSFYRSRMKNTQQVTQMDATASGNSLDRKPLDIIYSPRK
ncbi:MAG: hypothetical protein V4544_04810 [Pseudomonadota bacterium]